MVITQKKRIDQYAKIVEWLFVKNYTKGAGEIPFDGEEFKTVAGKLGFDLPDDLNDLARVRAIVSAAFAMKY
jgi:hypothetical protein